MWFCPQGVSENLILGQLAPVGTGYFELLIDETSLADAIEVGVMGVDDFSSGEHLSWLWPPF